MLISHRRETEVGLHIGFNSQRVLIVMLNNVSLISISCVLAGLCNNLFPIVLEIGGSP